MTHFPSKFFHATIWLASTFCLAITSATLVAGPVHSKLNEGLLAWYPFNGDTDDESGNGLDATNFGAFLAPDRFGHCDQAYLFPGNAYMTISDPESLLSFDARSNSYTVTVWVKLESLSQRQEFIMDRPFPAHIPCSYDIFYDNATGKFIADTWDGQVNVMLLSSTTPVVDQWYMLTMVDDGGMLKFYIDGDQEITPPLDSATPNQIPVNYGDTQNKLPGRTIGRFVGDFTAWYSYGYLDDIRIYDRALSPKEVMRLYRFHGFPRNQAN